MPDTVTDTINAAPTKQFFIYMLVRDVPLVRAIIDLVDNSLDGALRSGGDRLDDYWVTIQLDSNRFQIRDNCGGIPLYIASEYAFRFGRPPDAPPTEGSIGQFGVGMKRTIFKLGNYFCVRSATSHSRFSVRQDVKQWLQNAEEWSFGFESKESEVDVPIESRGTEVEVLNLHQAVSESFARETFLTELKIATENAHARSLQRGFRISINGTPLGVQEFRLLSSEHLSPAHVHLEMEAPPGSPHGVRINIYAGLSNERSFEKGGWYVFCNGRQVLAADQSSTTGWTEAFEAAEGEKDIKLPKYHADFAYFRGFVFFESQDSSLLPWTTTKTGVDSDSKVYRAALREMMKLMRPIIKFLRDLAEEAGEHNSSSQSEGSLAEAMKSAPNVIYSSIERIGAFASPARRARTRRDTVNIQYERPRELVEKVKRRLGAESARQVGEMTFTYFVEAECE